MLKNYIVTLKIVSLNCTNIEQFDCIFGSSKRSLSEHKTLLSKTLKSYRLKDFTSLLDIM